MHIVTGKVAEPSNTLAEEENSWMEDTISMEEYYNMENTETFTMKGFEP